MVDSDKSQATGHIQEVGKQNQTFLPGWCLLIFALAVLTIFLFQKGTPVDQALANAMSMLAVGVYIGVYGIWFFLERTCWSRVETVGAVGRDCLLGSVLFLDSYQRGYRPVVV